jgi:medium-chain acyl-[acyl-carrier-protein] hydrolase
MGALVCFELVRCLRRKKQKMPVHLFVSGSDAPHVDRKRDSVHEMPDENLVSKLRSLEGTSTEILESEEFVGLMLPALRADFKVCETYSYADEPPLDCAISVLGGMDDKECDISGLQAWGEMTNNRCLVHLFPGGHFFLHSSKLAVMQIIAREMLKYSDKARGIESAGTPMAREV